MFFNLTNRIVSTVDLVFHKLAINVKWKFLMLCTRKIFEMKPFEGNKIGEWSGGCEKICELFAVEQNGFGIVPMPPRIVTDDVKMYSPLQSSQDSAFEKELRADTGEESCNDILLSKEKKGSISTRFCEISGL